MQCPKCGETGLEAGTVICPRCDFILDTSFLGDDILNVTTGKQKPVRVSSAGDAVVIGGLDEEVELFSESTGSFLTADTVDIDREIVPAALYVGKSVQALMKPEAVLQRAPDVDKRKAMLSAFEQHVLSFIDGKRPVARLRKKTGLSSDDIRIAVGMLAEKGAVVLVGHVKKPSLANIVGDALASESGEHARVSFADSDDDDESGNYDLDATAEDANLGAELARARKDLESLPSRISGEWKPANFDELEEIGGPDDDLYDAKTAPSSPFDVERRTATPAHAPVAQEPPPLPLPLPRTGTPAATAALPRTGTPAATAALPRTGTPAVSAAMPSPARSGAGGGAGAGAGAGVSPMIPPRRPSGVLPRQPSQTGVPEPVRLAKERAAGFFELAHQELTKGNRVRAHVYAKLAADTDPEEPKYRELLATWPTAARRAVTVDAALFADADVAEKQGNFHKALALLEQALQANPSAAHIHNRRGLILATRLKRFSDATDALMKAVELEPNNVAFKNNLGKIIALANEKGGGAPSSPEPASAPGFLGKIKKAFDT